MSKRDIKQNHWLYAQRDFEQNHLLYETYIGL